MLPASAVWIAPPLYVVRFAEDWRFHTVAEYELGYILRQAKGMVVMSSYLAMHHCASQRVLAKGH